MDHRTATQENPKIGTAKRKRKDNLSISLLQATQQFIFRHKVVAVYKFVNTYTQSASKRQNGLAFGRHSANARGEVDRLNSLHIGVAELIRYLLHIVRKFVFRDKVVSLGSFVWFVIDLLRQKIPADFVQRFVVPRGRAALANSLQQFVRDMGFEDVILYYIQWVCWAIYNLIWVRRFCCDERFEVLFHEYETNNFEYRFGLWVRVHFNLTRWSPDSPWDAYPPILCVREENTRPIADMYGALEDFTDNQLQKTIFVYITNDTEPNFRMTETNKYFNVPVICVPKERNWKSANIFRKAVTSLLEQYKNMTGMDIGLADDKSSHYGDHVISKSIDE